MRAGIRLAIGPDGEAWFARSKPTPQIGRATGGPRYDVPPEIGDVAVLRLGDDGAFWLIAQSGVARMTTAGAFTKLTLPAELAAQRGFGVMAFIPGARGTMWVAHGPVLVQTDGTSVLRRVTLPNATIGVRDVVTACDGSLYVAETVPQIDTCCRTGTWMSSRSTGSLKFASSRAPAVAASG